jgi:hypothetical protein
MSQQITEYLCKQLGISAEDDCGRTKDQFIEEMQTIKNGCQAAGRSLEDWIEDPSKIDHAVTRLSALYKQNSKEDEIDDIIFFTDSNVDPCLTSF